MLYNLYRYPILIGGSVQAEIDELDLAAARRNLAVAMVMEQHMEQRHVDSDVAASVMEQHENRGQIMNKIKKIN